MQDWASVYHCNLLICRRCFLSRQSMSNNQKAAEVQKTADKYDEEIRTVTEEYNER